MQRPEARPQPPEAGRTRRAVLRLVLGQAQIIGATMTLYFMVKTGESALTFWSAGITALFTVTSKMLFRDRPGQPGGQGTTPPAPWAQRHPHAMHLLTLLALLVLLALFLYWSATGQKDEFRWQDFGW